MTAATASLAAGMRQRRLRLRLSALVIACLLVAAVIRPGITA